MKNFLSWRRSAESKTEQGEEQRGQFDERVNAISEQIFTTVAPNGRTAAVMRLLERPLNDDFIRSNLPEFTSEFVAQELARIANSESAAAYSTEFRKVLHPLLALAESHPVEFGELRRRNFLANGEFTAINEILSYNIDGNDLHIHFAPADDMGLGKARELFTQGLHELVKIIEKHEEVKFVSATSWMVAAQPTLIERFGFTVEGPIGEEERQRYFALETRPVSRAAITREDFLNRYRTE